MSLVWSKSLLYGGHYAIYTSKDQIKKNLKRVDCNIIAWEEITQDPHPDPPELFGYFRGFTLFCLSLLRCTFPRF